ncbi:MAG TPA: hypothetical protein VG755_31655 [Nannocystaceae bacterium]|nr:hypothetical protein [Nannocystaceae bacterium]
MARISAPLALVTTLAVLAACASEPDGSCVSDRRISLNRISLNRIALNRISLNGLLGAELPELALTSEALGAAIDPAVLADELAASVLEYTVSCALTAEQSVAVAVGDETRTFTGALGLAPQWGERDGECDGECRRWVSACLIARSNYTGESHEISLLGNRPELDPTVDESRDFDVEEATYFGDLFADPMTIYACVPEGASPPERTCGDGSDCAIAIVGACDEVCDTAGCRGANGDVFTQTITVNLRDDATSCE